MEKFTADKKDTRDDGKKLEAFKVDLTNDADAMQDVRDQANSDMQFVYTDGGQWQAVHRPRCREIEGNSAKYESDSFPRRGRRRMEIGIPHKARSFTAPMF